MIKLFVGGFPLDMDELELAKLFAPYGDIETLKIVRDKKTRVCKGYAFIEMKTREGADEAMHALDNLPMGDKKISVKEVVEPVTPAAKQSPAYQKVSRDIKSEKAKRPRRTNF